MAWCLHLSDAIFLYTLVTSRTLTLPNTGKCCANSCCTILGTITRKVYTRSHGERSFLNTIGLQQKESTDTELANGGLIARGPTELHSDRKHLRALTHSCF